MPCSGPRYFPAAISDVGFLGLREREIARQRDDAVQLGIEFFQTVEIDSREPVGSEFSLFDPSRKPRDRCERDVVILCRQWSGIGCS